MYCPHCGKQIPKGSIFCKHCGYKIQNQVTNNNHKSNHQKPINKLHFSSKQRNIFIIALIVIVLLIGGGVIYKYHSDHYLPRGIANQTITLSNDYDKSTYHIHSRSFSIKIHDGSPVEKYDIEKVHRIDGNHKVNVAVQGLNKHSGASSFTFDNYGGEFTAKPHGEF